MRKIAQVIFLGTALLAVAVNTLAQNEPTDARGSLVVVMKDGQRQTIPVAAISKIEFKDADVVVVKDGHRQIFPLAQVQSFEFDSSAGQGFPFGRNHFLGKWKVGIGNGDMGSFYITLKPNGVAEKSIGAGHGTWAVVDGEARITWDDGWRDVIRKAGGSHEKVAHEPGTTFSGESSNITDATRVDAQPI